LFNLSLLYLMLHRRMKQLDDRAILITFLKSLTASVMMGLVIYGALYLVASVVDMQKAWGILTQASIAGLAGFGVYVVIAWIWKCEEISAVKKFLKRIGGVKI
ncbi:unnamed protein product, partial [marine sediment metagenome]